MKRSLLMNFSVDRENKQINVKKEFAAPLENVWTAWTEPEYLDQWWAPKPFKTQTKTMDFQEGGHWLYAMVGPKGETHWCRADYEKINPRAEYQALDAFCDEEGTINTDFPRTHWKTRFEETSDSTMVYVRLTYKTLSDLEKIVELGFKEGFTMALGNLEELLNVQVKHD